MYAPELNNNNYIGNWYSWFGIRACLNNCIYLGAYIFPQMVYNYRGGKIKKYVMWSLVYG